MAFGYRCAWSTAGCSAESASLGSSRDSEHLGSRCPTVGESLSCNLQRSVADAHEFVDRWQLRNVIRLYGDASTVADRYRYFSASVPESPHLHCLGAATSNNILGPYSPQKTPLICPLLQGGAIDAAGFHDGSQRYIVYKVVGSQIPTATGEAC